MGKRKAEEEAAQDDSDRRVFVSRIPSSYDGAALKALFEKKFKCGVANAEIKMDIDLNVSKGFGFVTFVDPSDKQRAIAKGSIHKDQKNIKIMELIEESLVLGRGRDVGVCYNWSNFKCVKGAGCRFLHEGPGSCVEVRPPGEGLSRRRCLSFKSKGKCSDPDCKFLHEKNDKSFTPTGAPKECFSFKSKGKCRKGGNCLFEHIVK